jgi:hypothetical protein
MKSEVFEWRSTDSVAAACENPAVQHPWVVFAEVCDCRSPASVAEAGQLYTEFDALTLLSARPIAPQ